MKIYYGGRGNGKTIKAIKLSIEKQMPIVCWSYEHKKQIEQTAREIDALDILLRRILDDNVYYATVEECNIEKLERSNT